MPTKALLPKQGQLQSRLDIANAMSGLIENPNKTRRDYREIASLARRLANITTNIPQPNDNHLIVARDLHGIAQICFFIAKSPLNAAIENTAVIALSRAYNDDVTPSPSRNMEPIAPETAEEKSLVETKLSVLRKYNPPRNVVFRGGENDEGALMVAGLTLKRAVLYTITNVTPPTDLLRQNSQN